MNSVFDQDPLQELTQVVRKATPSVDERLLFLTLEATRIRALQIEGEREGNPPSVISRTMSQQLRRPTDEDLRRFRMQLMELELRASYGQKTLTQISKALRENLLDLDKALDGLGDSVSQEETAKKAIAQIYLEHLQELADTLYSSEEHWKFVIAMISSLRSSVSEEVILEGYTGKKSTSRPKKSDRAKEAKFLAEAQVRQDLLNQQRQSQLKQGQIVFLVALALLSFGVLLVFAGTIGIYIFNLTVGTITAVSGTVINLISAVILRFHKQENDRLDMITRELSILDRATIAMQYISQISDGEKKDQAIVDLTKQLYSVVNEQKFGKAKQ